MLWSTVYSLLCLWVWNSYVQLPVWCLLLFRCGISSSGGYTFTLMEVTSEACCLLWLILMWLMDFELLFLKPTPHCNHWPTPHPPAFHCRARHAVMWWDVMRRGVVWFCVAWCGLASDQPACLPWECSRIVCWENVSLRRIESSLEKELSATQKELLHGIC